MLEAMDRRTFVVGAAGLATALLAGCGAKGDEVVDEAAVSEEPTEEPEAAAAPEPEEAADETASQQVSEAQEEDDPMRIDVVVNGTTFSATLDEGPAGQGMLQRLPLSLHMEELHGNEKYSYVDEDFEGDSYVPETIEAGDLMVYNRDCVVLFYETFQNAGGYAYQRVGKIDDVSKLAEVCGKNSVNVEFRAR